MDERLQVDGRRLTDTERLKLLREEYEALDIQPLEIPNAKLVSARLVQYQKPVESLPGEPVAHDTSAQNSPSIQEPGQMEGLAGLVLTTI